MSASEKSEPQTVSDDPEIAALQKEITALTAERDACVARRKELVATEDPAAGVFYASEIFTLSQEKLRLDVEMEFRRKKINRIRLGVAEQSGGGGLPF